MPYTSLLGTPEPEESKKFVDTCKYMSDPCDKCVLLGTDNVCFKASNADTKPYSYEYTCECKVMQTHTNATRMLAWRRRVGLLKNLHATMIKPTSNADGVG